MSQLIAPQFAEIYQLDTAATAVNDLDGAGPQDGGYDEIFRTQEVYDSDEDGTFTLARTESGPILVACQVEHSSFESQAMVETGDNPSTNMKLIFDYCDLKANSLIDAKGKPTIRKNDRVSRILACDMTTTVQEFEDDRTTNEGLYISEVVTTFGFNGGELVIATLEAKQQGAFS